MNLLKDIVYSGYSESYSYQMRRAVMLTNYISLIYCAAILVIFVVRQSIYGQIPNGFTALFLFLGNILFLLPILFNRLKLTTTSRLLTSIIPVGFVWYVFLSIMAKVEVLETSMYDSLRMFLLVFSFTPYLLFEKKEWMYLVLAILPTLFSFLFFEVILTYAGFGYLEQGLPYDDYQLMWMRSMVAYVMVSGACYTFQTIIGNSDKYNLKILRQLQEQSDEIEAQNEELNQSQEKLNELNLHLESKVRAKTESLRLHNELLKKYAHANAHHVRGPVARLLGLLQLSKMESDISYPELFEKVEREAVEMDNVIKGISKDLNELDSKV